MPVGDNEVPLSLSTVCGGKLEEQFQELYPAMLATLKEGSKASIAITIEFQRVKDTTTMVNVGYKLTPRWPARSKASVCQITGDGKKIMTEKPVEKPKVVSMFENKEVGAGE